MFCIVIVRIYKFLFQNVVESETFISTLNQFASESKLKTIILMGYKLTDDNSSMKRQIGIFDDSADSLEKVSMDFLSFRLQFYFICDKKPLKKSILLIVVCYLYLVL